MIEAHLPERMLAYDTLPSATARRQKRGAAGQRPEAKARDRFSFTARQRPCKGL